MNKEKIYNPSKEILENSYLTESEFEKLYEESINNPNKFWATQAETYLDWEVKWDEVQNSNLTKGEVSWFQGGKLNASANCIDRHLAKRGDKTALIWEGDNPEESKNISYKELHAEVCKFSNVLKKRGVNKGDRVCCLLYTSPSPRD